MCELRYFQEILSWSSDPVELWLEKCRMIVESSVRYPEGLKIYFDNFEWLFDYLPTRAQASRELVESALPCFECAKMIKKERLFCGRA